MNDIIKPLIHRPKPPISEKAMEREVWHRLIVKIIRWQENPGLTAKITTKEWTTYVKSYFEINISLGKEKLRSKLEETKRLITDHGGFE